MRGFTVPQVSWEPLFNATPPAIGGDPPFGFNLYPDDGGPTRLLNDSVELVPIAPLPVIEFLVRDFESRKDGFTGALFTLPFGLRAFAEFSRTNQFTPALPGAKLALNRPEYEGARWRADYSFASTLPSIRPRVQSSREAPCSSTTCSAPTASPTGAGTLGQSVGVVFNNEFFYDGTPGNKPRGVPLTRIDFSGYGASVFSHWQNPNAAIAATSQAHFDVFVGRTAGEVIQIRSLLYPVGRPRRPDDHDLPGQQRQCLPVRHGLAGGVRRGLRLPLQRVRPPPLRLAPQNNPYVFHPGIVGGVFNVRNIRETDAIPDFTATWNKLIGEHYIDVNGVLRTVDRAHAVRRPIAGGRPPAPLLRCRRGIQGVTSGATGGRVPSKGMLGLRPALARAASRSRRSCSSKLLASSSAHSAGRWTAWSTSAEAASSMRIEPRGRELLAGRRGPADLRGRRPRHRRASQDGSWSVVQHDQGTGEVSPLDAQATVPLIRRGRLDSQYGNDRRRRRMTCSAWPTRSISCGRPVAANAQLRTLAVDRDPEGAVPPARLQAGRRRGPRGTRPTSPTPTASSTRRASSRTCRTRSRWPSARSRRRSSPKATACSTRPTRTRCSSSCCREGPLYLINETFLKLYVEYAKKDKNGNTTADGHVRYGFDASAADLGKKWLSKVNDIGMVVDLGPLSRLMMIKGKFDAEKGSAPGFIEPEIEFSDALQPVIDILQILLMLQGGRLPGRVPEGPRDRDEQLGRELELRLPRAEGDPARQVPARPALRRPDSTR